MKQVLHFIHKWQRLTVLGLAALTFGAGLAVAGVPAANAAAVSCRVFTPKIAFYEGGSRATNTYYVPGTSVSGCKDINIRNVQNQQVASDNCATFRVQMFPTWGDPFYTNPKTVCSKGPNGPVVPIATDVLNGTKYRVWYGVENLNWTHTFQIVD